MDRSCSTARNRERVSKPRWPPSWDGRSRSTRWPKQSLPIGRPSLLLPRQGEMLSAMLRRSPFIVLSVLAVATLAGCERRGGCTGPNCGTVVYAAIAEPSTLLPPSTEDVVAGDLGEQLFLKLADVGMSTNTVGDEDFQPLLAQRWEWDGPLTLVFHVDPRARWHAGQRVTEADEIGR